jgi:sulfatase maturation enzyme AslB (radical SAM superfamily)
MDNFKNLKHISVYLGNTCNFDCTYCDREYIAKDIGGQTIKTSYIELLDGFFDTIAPSIQGLEVISVHGGEPFLFISRMDRIFTKLYDKYIKGTGRRFAITTNGSLIAANKEFIKKWGPHLKFTISYDFMFQSQNREPIDVVEMSKIIQDSGATMQWQYVMPTDDPRCFDLDSVTNIVRTCKETNCNTINLIPLRHRRGARKFEVIIDNIPLVEWFDSFLKFITILYTKNIDLYVDGTYGALDDIDKYYYDNHHKLILSPDGYMYPEYDFLEYKRTEFKVGQWTDGSPGFEPKFYRQQDELNLIREDCFTCPSKDSCGLKYLYKMFDREPGGNCVTFYKMVDTAIAYCYKLQKKDSVFEWVGID